MNKGRRIWAVVLLSFTMLLMVAGCAKSETETEAPPIQEPVEAEAFDPSGGIDADGRWEGIHALDYVEIAETPVFTIPSGIHEITDEAMDSEIEALISYYVTSEKRTEGVIEYGDTVHMDYVGSIDGVEFEGGTTRGLGTAVVIGETAYIDDFLDQLVGHSPGDRFDVEVTFPENYTNAELSGKDAVFDVTINYIIETVTPEWTDEFVEESLSADYGARTTQEMELYIRETLSRLNTEVYLELQLTETFPVSEIPESLVSYQERYLVDRYEMLAEANGITLAEYLESTAGILSTEEMLGLYVEEIATEAKEDLVTQAIAEHAGIIITDEDVAAYFREVVGIEDYSEYEDMYGMPYLKMTILKQFVLDYLRDNSMKE